ncbi:MAG TPA: CAP domain-containing protein [Ilumatobacter sp.]|nr:CAP domain-containing protein [Ilumatobacter sp.]
MNPHNRLIGALGRHRATWLLAGIIGSALLVGTTVGASVPTLDQAARIGTQAVRFDPPPPPPPTTVPSSHELVLAATLDAINAARAGAGLAPVQRNHLMELAAQGHSDEMAARRLLTHTGANGSSAGDRLTAVGFQWSGWAENIGAGFVDPNEIVQSWMDSSAHRRNLLGNYVYIGVGIASSVDGVQYWTLDLAS